MLTENESNKNSDNDIINAIIPSFREKARLLGLVGGRIEDILYHEDIVDGKRVIFKKRVLPNAYARMDILLVDSEIAGTIVCCKISEEVYHMVGMYVREEFRSKKNNTDAPLEIPPVANQLSPAKLLLKYFLQDVIPKGTQVSLEVLNHNKSAWNLYEKKLYFDVLLKRQKGFSLMTPDEIIKYAKARRKKIGKWHEVENADGTIAKGVQWSHIPDFDGTPRWSINRLYLIKTDSHEFSLNPDIYHWLKINLKMAYSVIKYGKLYLFIKRYITLKIVERKKGGL
ncbi:GNAT family protein [Aurantivibrio infirmus]